MCEVAISRDVDLIYGFLEKVTDAFLGLVSLGGGDGHLFIIPRISKSTNC